MLAAYHSRQINDSWIGYERRKGIKNNDNLYYQMTIHHGQYIKQGTPNTVGCGEHLY